MDSITPTERRRFQPNSVCGAASIRRSEDSLLLACAGTSCGRENRETIRRLARDCKDWNYVLEAARRHGITALVRSSLDQAAADIVPCEPLANLRRRFRAIAARNLFLTQELLSLLREFGARRIEAIPFKGPLLAITAYGNVALREFLDLDVLVPRKHFDRSRQLLAQRGYQQPAEQTGARESSHIESQLGCDYIRKRDRMTVELHWSFIQKWLGFAVDLDALWKAPDRVSLGGMEVRTLPADLTLLYLCAHGAKHRWSRLCWVVDVAQVLRAQAGLDWEGLLKTAEHAGSQRTLWLGLHLAQELLGSEFPQHVRTAMKGDRAAAALAQKLCVALFPSEIRDQSTRLGPGKDLFYLLTKERWKDRLLYLRYAASWLVSPSQKDRQWIPLPSGLGWLYFILRPVRVACAFLRPRSRNWN